MKSNKSRYADMRQLLKDFRKNRGLRQAELAKILNRPQSFVSKYESGERRLDIVELEEVCGALGISISDFASRFERLKGNAAE